MDPLHATIEEFAAEGYTRNRDFSPRGVMGDAWLVF
jgi:hypothetical protein